MNWFEFFSSAAIGSGLGLSVKEFIDWLRTERNHRLELRKRYFDSKLDATIRVIRQMKHATTTLRSFTSLVKENEESGGWIHPGLLNIVTQSFGKNGEKINEEAAGVSALLGFYYDDELARMAGLNSPTPFLQKLSEFMYHIEKSTEAQNVLNASVPPPPDAKEVAEKLVKFHDEQMRATVPEMATFADALDELADEVVRRMRKDFKNVRF